MSPRVGIFIQARGNSGRLPGKIYEGLPGPGHASMLEHIHGRLSRISGVAITAVLAPDGDERLIRFCRERSIPCVTGPEDDVRSRYRLAARLYRTDVVMRATGDNPCVDPGVAEYTLREFLRQDVDLLSCVNLPLGVAVEVFSREALESDRVLAEDSHREHVSIHIKRNPRYFKVEHPDYPWMPALEKSPRLTVDTAPDLQVVRRAYRELGPNFTLDEVLRLFRKRPELFAGNEHVEQRLVAVG